MKYNIIATLCALLVFAFITSCSKPNKASSHDSISESAECAEDKENDISEMTEEEILNSPKFKAKMRELAPIYAKQMSLFNLLQSEWTKCITNKEKIQFINDHEYEVGMEFDVDISTISKAEYIFVTHPENFLKAMELRLKARAAGELAEESYQKAFELKYSE